MNSKRGVFAALVVGGLLAGLFVGAPVEAGGANLTGRHAPDLVFPTGLNGLPSGGRLSQFRGSVVLLKFWIHNCPICLSQMPRIQQTYDRWREFGLEVVTVVHRVNAAKVQGLLTAKRWTFPVSLDPEGRLGTRYRVRRRPALYLIGADGRVLASNRATEGQIVKALGAQRVKGLRPIPEGADAIVDAVRTGNTGTALRLAQAREPEGSAFLKRVRDVAEADLRAHGARARRWIRARRAALAQQDLQVLQTEYVHTSLADLAKNERARALQ